MVWLLIVRWLFHESFSWYSLMVFGGFLSSGAFRCLFTRSGLPGGFLEGFLRDVKLLFPSPANSPGFEGPEEDGTPRTPEMLQKNIGYQKNKNKQQSLQTTRPKNSTHHLHTS